MAANKVFIVEDDAVIARAVAAHLTTWQMQVQCLSLIHISEPTRH